MGRKNNKKKSFSDNLANLFQERMLDDNAQDNISMIENDSKSKKTIKTSTATAVAKKKTTKKARGKSKTTRKSFSNNLERFFKDSIDGVLDGVVTDVKRTLVNTKKGNRKAIGIDLLIKRTTEENVKDKPNKQVTQTKRVTVVLDTEKLEELKRIAKEEKRRLHQIIGELVDEYIDEAKK
jgi:hypothetical protein